MNWTTPTDICAQVQRMWERGDLLRAATSASVSWPLRLKLKAPSAKDLTNRFEEVRSWAHTVTETPKVRFEWQEWNHRIQGSQRLPASVWLDSLDAALALIGRTRQLQRFWSLHEQTTAMQPELLAWLSEHPLQVLNLAESWERLLAIVAWLKSHPRPGVYLRQVDVLGVDTKFIERNQSVLAELFELALPPEFVDSTATGVKGFNRRFGFLDKPIRIRFRLLDPTLPHLPGCEGLHDISLDSSSFATLAIPIERVFITENETNFLSFPPVARAIVVFGAGYGWEPLARALWLHRCHIHYWGDIDTHGFAILNQLRRYFPHVSSILMDRETLLRHQPHWGVESKPAYHDLPHLTSDEAEVYDALRFSRFQPELRLEQERISFGWLNEQLARLFCAHTVQHELIHNNTASDHRIPEQSQP